MSDHRERHRDRGTRRPLGAAEPAGPVGLGAAGATGAALVRRARSCSASCSSCSCRSGYAIYTSLYTTRIIGGTDVHRRRQLHPDPAVGRVLVRRHPGDHLRGDPDPGHAGHRVLLRDASSTSGVAKFGTFFRTIFFIPFAVPAVVGAVMWSLPARAAVRAVHPPGQRARLRATPTSSSSSLILPSIIVIVDLGVDRLQHDDPLHRAQVGAARRRRGRHPRRHAAVEDHPADEAAHGPPGHRAAGLPQHDRRAAAVHRAADPDVLRDRAISVNYTPTLYIYNTAIAGDQYQPGRGGAR